MTDRLSLTNALAEANIDRAKAERIATEIYDAIHENVATKADIADLRAELRAMGQRLERQINGVVTRLGAPAVVLLGLLFGALHLWPSHG